jgi:hypothetical protein
MIEEQNKVNIAITRCQARILELSSLLDGWHDGSGKAPTETAILAGKTLLTLCPDMAPLFHIFPTEAGGLLFEFTLADWYYSVEIHDGIVEIYGVEENCKAEIQQEFTTLDSPEFRVEFEKITKKQVAYHPSELPEYIKKAIRETQMGTEHDHLNKLMD